MSWMKRRSHVNPNTVPGSHVPLYNPNQHSNQENQWPTSQDVTSTSTNNWYTQQSQNNTTTTQKAYGYNQQNSGQMAPQQHQNYWHQQHDQQSHYGESPQTYPCIQQQGQYQQQGFNQMNYYQNPLDQQPQGTLLNDQYNQQYAQYPNVEVQNNPYRQVTQNTESTDTWGNNWGWGDEDNSNVQQNIPAATDNSNQVTAISESFNTEESWNWNVEDSTSTSKNDESSASISQASLDVLTNPESVKDVFPKMGKLSEKHQKSNFETVDNEKFNPNIVKVEKIDHLTPQWSTESQMSQESSDDILQTSESDKMLSRSSTISQSPISGQEASTVDSLPQIEEHDSLNLIKEEYKAMPEAENSPTKYIGNIEILPQIKQEVHIKSTEGQISQSPPMRHRRSSPPSNIKPSQSPSTLTKRPQSPPTNANNNSSAKRGESPTRNNVRTIGESPSPTYRRGQSPPIKDTSNNSNRNRSQSPEQMVKRTHSPPPRNKSPVLGKNTTPPLASSLNKSKNVTPPPGSSTTSKLSNITPPPQGILSPPPQSLTAAHQNLPNLGAKMGVTMMYNVLTDESKGAGSFKRPGNVSLPHNKPPAGIPIAEGRRSPRYARSKSPAYNQMNLETVPDNSEQPDNVQVPLTRKVSADAQRQGQQGQLPDNNEMISERNQYLETGKLSDENLKQELVDTLPPPGLRRMVLGQMETNEVRAANDEPPPGLSRMVLGQTESTPSMKLGFPRMIPGESSSPETSRQYQLSYMDEPQDSEGEMNQLIASAPQQRSATIGADTPPVLANPNRSDTIIGQDSNQEKDKERPESIEGQPTEPANVNVITTGMRDLAVDSSSSILDDNARRKDSSDSDGEDERSRSSRDKRDRRYGRDDRRPAADKRYSPLESYDRNGAKRYDRRRRDRHYEEDTDYYSDKERDKDHEEYDGSRKYSSLRRDKDKEKDRDRDRRRRDGYDRRGDVYDRDPSRMKKENYDGRKNSERDFERNKESSREYQRDYSGYDNLNNGRDNGALRERELRGKDSRDGYDVRKETSSKDYYERDRKDGRDRKDREYDRDRRDYERGRNKGDYYDRYGRYEDRYDDRSRPSSRSDSMRETFRDRDDERRYIARERERATRRQRDFNSYMQGFGYDPYNPYYQQYQMYYENLRRTNPQAYAEWYRKYYQQATGAAPTGTYGTEDRASVHSGRSSANDEMKESYGRPYDATNSSVMDDTQAQRLTPAKFATAHTKASISSGKCVRILPHYPLDGQNAVVEFVNMQKLLINDDEMEELVNFPGPLIRGITPKKTVIEYCESKIRKAAYDDDLTDTDSYILLWELMILLIRQNGMVVGTDIAELLMKHKHVHFRPASANSEGSSVPNDGNSSDPSNIQSDHAYGAGNFTAKSEDVTTNKFREYLMYGSGKEALEWAMKHGLWGHALFLASKLDKRTYANVMMRFANGLTMNDPLQTLYQLLSGRLPASVTCVADEKWGDWRPHLAMILSNTTSRPDLDRKAITTMADTLMNRGSLYAAQFCYLMAEVGFSRYGAETAKLVLLGSSHHKPHLQFATNEAIHLTEIYEYACSLNDPDFLILEFQAYKFVISTRLADRGLLEKALSYLERVAMAIIRHTSGIQPHLIERVSDLADRLKHVDPMGDADDVTGSVSSWLKELKSVQDDYNNGLLYQDNNGAASRLPTEYDSSQQPASQYEQDRQQDAWQPQPAQGEAFPQGSGQWPTEKGHERGQQEMQAQPDQQQQQEVITGYNTNQYQEQPQQYWVNQHQQHWNESSQSSLDQYHQGLQQQPDGQQVDNQHHLVQQQQGQIQHQDVNIGQHQQHQDLSLNNDYWSNATQQAHNEDAAVRPQISMPNQQSRGAEGSEEVAQDSARKKQQDKSAKTGDKANKQASSGWFGGIFSRLALRPKNQMKLPDDKNPSIVWDPEKKKWVNLEEDQTDSANELKPPPKMSDMIPKMNAPPVGQPGSTVVGYDQGYQGSYPSSYQPPNQPDSLTMIDSQPNSLIMSANQPVMYNPSGMQVSGGIQQQQQYAAASINPAALPTVPANTEEAPKPNQSNMFKLQRGRNLKKSYVDVFNPSGKPSPAPAMIAAPLMANAVPGGEAQMNFFIPTPVNDPNAPTDFLTPAPVHTEPQAQIPQ